MAEKKSKTLFRGEEFKTKECRFSFAHGLFTVNEDGKYTASLIFQKSAVPHLNAQLKAAILGAWGDAGATKFKNGLIKNPILDGAGKEARSKKTGELHEGMGEDVVFIRVATKFEPTVRTYESKNTPATYGTGQGKLKSGDFGFAVLQPFAWNSSESGDGVSFGVNYVQKTRDGESLGGSSGVDVDKYFETINTGSETSTGGDASSLFD